MFGYFIGATLFEELGKPILELYNAAEAFAIATDAYNKDGALIVFTAGFSPIPYKIVTIASGVAAMDPVTFTLASMVGRGARFFLVAILLWKFGAPIQAFIEKRLGLLTLLFCVFLIAGVIIVKVLT
jgi:membrane protein YqaA with SNARE-associated domain